jgi:two-component system cell cycle response regulator
MIIKKAFRLFDCVFCEAGNGEEGLAAAATEKPDLIILDITMPVMDGCAMLGKLRADPALKSVPVIMLTAESSAGNVASVSQLGISDYIVKPFKESVLLEKVQKVLPLAPVAA